MKSFRLTVKYRLLDTSEIRVTDFEGEFRRSAICSVPATIGINRPIPDVSISAHPFAWMPKLPSLPIGNPFPRISILEGVIPK
jgi:hypothetical protein